MIDKDELRRGELGWFCGEWRIGQNAQSQERRVFVFVREEFMSRVFISILERLH